MGAPDAPTIPPPSEGDALLVVDMQRDFLPGGALPVPGADEVVGPIDEWLRVFERASLPVFATRDWHPEGHCSFAERGGPWPRHCVAGSEGAQFAAGLHWPRGLEVVSKASTHDAEACSGFQGTALAARLRAAGARRLFVCGVATDHCVRHTVSDALAGGFDVVLLPECMRAVDAHPGDGEAAFEEMAARGAKAWRGPAGPASARTGWEHFDHGADIGVRGWGPTRARAFEQAAIAMTAVITDPGRVAAAQRVELACEAADDELLFVAWLNALVTEMAVRRMLFGRFEVVLDGTRLHASVWGEPASARRHAPAVEVKGATYTQLRVARTPAGGWLAQTVVDV
jgi:nicotinamidase/pyrazinamidase